MRLALSKGYVWFDLTSWHLVADQCLVIQPIKGVPTDSMPNC